MKKMLRMGCTVAALGTGTLLSACGSESSPELAAESLATVQLALVSVPKDVSCVRAKVKGDSRTVVRDQDVVPGKSSTFSLSGLPAGKVTFDMDAFSVPCVKIGRSQVPTWVADSQSVVLTNGASTPVSVTLRPNAVADVKADFVDDGTTPPPPPPPPPPGGLRFSPQFFDFGNVAIGKVAVTDFKLVNESPMPLPAMVFFLNSDPDVSANSSDCNRLLPPSSVCLVRVTFAPKTAHSFKVQLAANSGPGQALATVSGFSNSSPPPPPPPPSGLIGHWSFNAVKGSVVADDSNNGNTGEIVQGQTPNAPPVSGVIVPGKVGSALDLSPQNTWVRIKRSDSIDSTGTTGSFTLSAWVKTGMTPNPQGFNHVISRQEVGTSFQHFGLGLQDGKPTAIVHFFFTAAAESLPPGQWAHVATTYDGITSTVYVNGVAAASLDIGWPIAADTTNTIIGGAQLVDTVKEFFGGAVDEVKLHNVALTQMEVQALAK